MLAVAAVAKSVHPADAQAQDGPRQTGGRDLVVTVAGPASRRPVHVSLMPIGPSSIAIGDRLGFRMVSTADGFGGLYVLSASGRTQAWLENIRLHAGEPIVYPRRGLIVRAAPPAGDETMIFIAARDRIQGLAGPGALTSPLDLQFTAEGLRNALQQHYRDLPRERWAFAEIRIRVHD
jgi:hypothetical protein